jgi:hypothetical protein
VHFRINWQPKSNVCNQAQISNLLGNFGKPLLADALVPFYSSKVSIKTALIFKMSLLSNLARLLTILSNEMVLI